MEQKKRPMERRFLQRDFPSFFFVFMVLFFLFTLLFLFYNISDPSVPTQEKAGWALTTFSAACTTTVMGLVIHGRRRRPN